MYKFYKCKEYLNNGSKKILLGMYDEIKSPEKTNQFIPIDTFEELWYLAEKSPYLYRSVTVFTGKKEVFYYDHNSNDMWASPLKYTEDKFKPLIFEKIYKEFKPTVDYLHQHLTLEEFLKYEEETKEQLIKR